MSTVKEPKHFRKPSTHIIGWEIYSRKVWFVNIALGKLEIQINKWR